MPEDNRNLPKVQMNDSLDGHILPVVSVVSNWERPLYSEEKIDTAEKAVNLVGSYLAMFTDEHSAVICLDHLMRPICVAIIGVGDLFGVTQAPRDIIRLALLTNAAVVIDMHNHPDRYGKDTHPKPSARDVTNTDAIQKACDLFGIKYWDSIVIGPKADGIEFYSMRERKTRGVKFHRTMIGEMLSINNPFNPFSSRHLTSSECLLDWDNKMKLSDKYWNMDLDDQKPSDIKVAYSPEELKALVDQVHENRERITEMQEQIKNERTDD